MTDMSNTNSDHSLDSVEIISTRKRKSEGYYNSEKMKNEIITKEPRKATQEEGQKSKQQIKNRNFQCEQCKKVFKQKYLLKRHFAVHTGERKFVCSICDKAYKLRSTLDHHYEVHSTERMFACSLCQQTFSRKSTLQMHMAIHAKEKKFICNICGKDFVQKGNLLNHMNVHSNRRPYKCTICGSGYNQASNLRIHVQTTHSADATHKCKLCGETFNVKNALKKHELDAHRLFAVELEDIPETPDHNTADYSNNIDNDMLLNEKIDSIKYAIGCVDTPPSGNHNMSLSEIVNTAETSDFTHSNNTTLGICYPLDGGTETQSSSGFLSPNLSNSFLIFVDNQTGQVSIPMIQGPSATPPADSNDKVLQLLIDTDETEEMLPAQHEFCDPNARTSNLHFLAEKWVQSEPSVVGGQVSLEETMKFLSSDDLDMCMG